ncbi:MAG: hypothetical protein R6U11_07725 [Bacteroidales bacterium]
MEQEEQDEFANIGFSQPPMQQESGLQQWRTNVKRDINELANHLEGKEFDSTKGRYENTGYGVCNHKGAAEARVWLNSIVNTSTIQGSIDEEEWRNIICHRAETLIQRLCRPTVYNNLGLQNEENRTEFIMRLVSFAFLTLSRSIDNEERRTITTQSKEQVLQRVRDLLPERKESKGLFG